MADEKLLGRFEMLWDCSFCGKTKLLGITHRHCPECGAPQDQTKRYFPSEEDKVAVKDDYAGNDRACPNCKHANGGKATFCAQCGAPLDEAAAVKKRADQVVQQGQAFAADDAKKAEAELSDKAKPKPVMAVKKKSYTWLYVLLGVAGLFFLIWFMCIRKRSADFTVEGQHWTRQVVVEQYTSVKHDEWQDRIPSTAQRVDNCHDAQFDSKKVPDGQDCQTRRRDKGDGTFEERQECTPRYRSEPIYKTKCSYWTLEWVADDDRTMRATADDGKEPPWPDPGIKPGGLIREGSLREGPRTEIFSVDLVEKGGRKHHCDLSQERWAKLKKGTAARGQVRARSGEIVCSELKPK